MARQKQRTVKATFSIDADLLARINARAFLRGQSRDVLVTAALEQAVRGLVLYERVGPTACVPSEGSAEIADEVIETVPAPAA